MTEKKTDKKEKIVTKKSKKTEVTKSQVGASNKIESLAEDKYFACEIADNLNIPGFAFHIMKQEAGIKDNSFLTISEFQEIYNKIVGR